MTPRLYIAKSGARQAPSLPVDAVTRTIAVLGQRGTGKTNTAVVVAEEVARRGGHVAILDPVGAWYGITRRGEKAGIEGIVIGGEHGDVPLEETAGGLVAELVIGRHWPVVVIDLKLLRKGAQMRFMADYLEGLFHSNREPLLQVFEEADRPLPQAPRGMDPVLGRVLGAGEDIVKLGRSRGLGALLVTQRPATLNKNVLEVCEALALHRLMGPNDRKAVKGWVEANGDPRALKIVMESMAQLARGEAWLYAPGWLGEDYPPTRRPDQPAAGLVRMRLRHRHTFDSSGTPEVGQQVAEPTQRAPVDLAELRERMAATVERQRENDPRELRKRIVELEGALAESAAEHEAALEDLGRVVEEREVYVPDREAVEQLTDAANVLAGAAGTIEAKAIELRGAHEHVERLAASVHEAERAIEAQLTELAKLPPEGQRVEAPYERHPEGVRAADVAADVIKRAGLAPRGDSSNGVSGPEQRILNALAWWHSVGVRTPSRLQLAVVACYHERTKSYTNALGAMNGRLVHYPAPGLVELTSEGRDAAVWPERPGTSAELQRRVLEQVRGPRARVLEVLIDRRGHAYERGALAEQLGYHERTKSFTNALGSLRSLGFVEYPAPGYVRAADVLFIDRVAA